MKSKKQRQTGPAGWRGGVTRRASWFCAMALSAALAIPLGAEVIDDFEDGVKFAAGGAGMDYFEWDVTDGQLVVSKWVPVPTTPDNVLLTYDNVYWPAPRLPVDNLENGRTLEVRVDRVHANADDLFMLLMCGGQNVGADFVYAVLVDRNEVALMKWREGGNSTIFHWDTMEPTTNNVTVRLGFTKADSSLNITVKVVDKDNPGVTLYAKSFADGPGPDAPVPPPDPHGVGLLTADEEQILVGAVMKYETLANGDRFVLEGFFYQLADDTIVAEAWFVPDLGTGKFKGATGQLTELRAIPGGYVMEGTITTVGASKK